MGSDKFERYRELLAEHPGEQNKWYAKELGVTPGTVGRWNRKLSDHSIEERLRAKLEAEFEEKLRAVLDEHESERQERERKKREAEEQADVSRRAYFQRILDECQKVDIYPSETVPVTWQGFTYTLIGGQTNTVPEVIAGVWKTSQGAQQEAEQIIRSYTKGQYLGKY